MSLRKVRSFAGGDSLEDQKQYIARLEGSLAPLLGSLKHGQDPSREEVMDCFTSHRRRGEKVANYNRTRRVESVFTQCLAADSDPAQLDVARQMAGALYHLDGMIGGTTDGFNRALNNFDSIIGENTGNPDRMRMNLLQACATMTASQSSKDFIQRLKGRPKEHQLVAQPIGAATASIPIPTAGEIEGQAELIPRIEAALGPVLLVLNPLEDPSREQIITSFTTRARKSGLTAAERRVARLEELFPRLLGVEKSPQQLDIARRLASTLYRIDVVEGREGTQFNCHCNYVLDAINLQEGDPPTLRNTLGSAFTSMENCSGTRTLTDCHRSINAKLNH